MWEHWVSCLQQNGWRLILCRKASLPASLAYMSQDRHRRAKLSSSALERVLKQPKIHNSKLLRNFLHTFVCVHICMRRFVHVICFWLSVLPVGCCPSLLLELGNYYVVRMGWRWKLFYSENPLYQIQHFSTPFPGHVFFFCLLWGLTITCADISGQVLLLHSALCSILPVSISCQINCLLPSSLPIKSLPDLSQTTAAILMILSAARLTEFQQYWQISASVSFFPLPFKHTSEIELGVWECGGGLPSLEQVFCHELQKAFSMVALREVSGPARSRDGWPKPKSVTTGIVNSRITRAIISRKSVNTATLNSLHCIAEVWRVLLSHAQPPDSSSASKTSCKVLDSYRVGRNIGRSWIKVHFT